MKRPYAYSVALIHSGALQRRAACRRRREPVRQPDVVGMEVGGDQQRTSGLPPNARVEQLLPRRLRGVGGDAAVDDGVARAAVDLVVEQPQVDVVERERQRHPHPVQPGRSVVARAGGGHVGHG
jgi:hypothetical protein